MKNIILFLSAFTFSVICTAGEEPFHWEPLSVPGVKKFFTSKKHEDTFLSLTEVNDEFDLNQFEPEVYIKALPELRSNGNRVLDITNFRIEASKVKRSPASWQIELEGSFLRNGSVPIHFCESHTFTASRFSQQQFNFPTRFTSKFLSKSSECLQLLNSELGKLK